MGWLDSLFGVPNAPHNWFGGGGGSNPGNWAGGSSFRDTDDLRMRGFAEHALRPNFRGQGSFYQMWQNQQNPGGFVPQEPGPAPVPQPYAPPEQPPAFGGYAPPEGPPARMPPNVPTPWTGGPQPLQPTRYGPPRGGVIRK